MASLFEALENDIHFREGLKACISCGTCIAICPATEYYDYDPRAVVEVVQRGNEDELESLLKSDTIWYCGECMSCRTRCPRNNTPGTDYYGITLTGSGYRILYGIRKRPPANLS